ncbi:hypothetical protein [Dechloromonas sp. HYN0024]|uniref:hypothetical protein n=1 Tax=Dechloromonas sp. HYN0024 TaxID=2231055 RepID=UPI000E43B7F9|nr:hypothetical protein [Dechloromonas sp. HYN0024]AXS79855.1 hypothetical protein HYN24_07395 [Dechloromonas sp. HYN0024]
MKSEDIVTLIAGGILAYVAWKTFTRTPAAPQVVNKPINAVGGMYAKNVTNSALPSEPGYAWQYFDNGTAIDPQGNYYLNGNLVWSAP